MSRRRAPAPEPGPPRQLALGEQRAYDRVDEVAGHRVVRRYAVGTRATLLLAAAHGAQKEAPTQRLIKVFHPRTDRGEVEVEIAGLCALENAHVVRLIDVATVEPGDPPCLVLERLRGPSLASYLDEEQTIDAGAAVSIVAPLCSALQRLHEAGVTHGSLHPRRVVFDATGAPVLTGFGRGILRANGSAARKISSAHDELDRTTAEVEWSDARRNDVRDLIELAQLVFRRVEPVNATPRETFTSARNGVLSLSSTESLARLEAALFAIAPAQPVLLDTEAQTTASPGEGRPIAPVRVGPSTTVGGAEQAAKSGPDSPRTDDSAWAIEPEHPATDTSEPRIISALRVLGASPSLLDGLSRAIESVSQLRRGRKEPKATASVPRRRLVVLAAMGIAIVATVIILALPTDSHFRTTGAGQQTASGSAPTERGDGQASAEDEIVPPADATVLTGDDPAAALTELIRVGGFESDADAATIDGAPPVVTRRWGGSALVAASLNGQPASFLLVKGEAGWRIRDVFDADG